MGGGGISFLDGSRAVRANGAVGKVCGMRTSVRWSDGDGDVGVHETGTQGIFGIRKVDFLAFFSHGSSRNHSYSTGKPTEQMQCNITSRLTADERSAFLTNGVSIPMPLSSSSYAHRETPALPPIIPNPLSLTMCWPNPCPSPGPVPRANRGQIKTTGPLHGRRKDNDSEKGAEHTNLPAEKRL